ncbi:hypothetical protein CXG81DRAFT_23404 [Caulochytrium protostelioides]|uniref:Uncharacterized protein n=1 Tax=Caulochytrium protostelioides TaxID=1555241 RepID=A0A4P9XEP8_9FUNG|nr:hypothetical protein CXG81DRAFT_23404 [Caulochytrium protostelioides]|eukprot:RKP03992.1 hypothetical protein CXG81DRAFT_23404 [Caulochytrium protostelioides]
MRVTTYAGVGLLCFVPAPDDPATGAAPWAWWQGHLFTAAGATFRIQGSRAAEPPAVHRCCWGEDGPPAFWDVVVAPNGDAAPLPIPWTAKAVRQRGAGDAIALRLGGGHDTDAEDAGDVDAHAQGHAHVSASASASASTETDGASHDHAAHAQTNITAFRFEPQTILRDDEAAALFRR